MIIWNDLTDMKKVSDWPPGLVLIASGTPVDLKEIKARTKGSAPDIGESEGYGEAEDGLSFDPYSAYYSRIFFGSLRYPFSPVAWKICCLATEAYPDDMDSPVYPLQAFIDYVGYTVRAKREKRPIFVDIEVEEGVIRHTFTSSGFREVKFIEASRYEGEGDIVLSPREAVKFKPLAVSPYQPYDRLMDEASRTKKKAIVACMGFLAGLYFMGQSVYGLGQAYQIARENKNLALQVKRTERLIRAKRKLVGNLDFVAALQKEQFLNKRLEGIPCPIKEEGNRLVVPYLCKDELAKRKIPYMVDWEKKEVIVLR